MSGNGKYTVYAPPANAKNDLMKKLFGKNGGTALPPQMANDAGKEIDVKTQLVDIAKAQLTPAKQAGDLGYFPDGVQLDFSGAPKTEDVKWALPGDPANPYTPDITSPGPGKTSGADKDADPKISAADLKPTYVPQGPDTGTKSPDDTSSQIVTSNALEADPSKNKLKLGKSGA